MRILMMMGLAAIAALATMAIAGAGTASATTLCKANEDPCGETNRYASGTELGMQLSGGSEFVIAFGLGSRKCGESTMGAKTTAASGASLPALITSLIGNSCSGPCSTMQVSTPWATSIEGTGAGKATVTVSEVEIRFTNCAFGVKECTFAGNVEAPLSGSPLQLAIKNAPLARIAGPPLLCGAEALMSGTYTVTSPSPLFISQKP